MKIYSEMKLFVQIHSIFNNNICYQTKSPLKAFSLTSGGEKCKPLIALDAFELRWLYDREYRKYSMSLQFS